MCSFDLFKTVVLRYPFLMQASQSTEACDPGAIVKLPTAMWGFTTAPVPQSYFFSDALKKKRYIIFLREVDQKQICLYSLREGPQNFPTVHYPRPK